MKPQFLLLGALVAVAAVLGLLGSRPAIPSSEAAPALAPDAVVANASADLELADVHQLVPGLSLTLDNPNLYGAGNWKVEVCLLFQGTGAGDEGRSAAFRLLLGDTPVDGAGVTRLYANIFQTTCYVWLIDIAPAASQTLHVTARKETGATGDSRILQGALNTTSRMVATPEPPPPTSLAANAIANLVLQDVHQDVPGLSLDLPGAAWWKVEVCLLFQGTGGGDEGRSAAFRLLVDGTPVDGAGVTRLYANIFQTTCYTWLLEIAGPSHVQVTARKDTGATGDSRILQGALNTTSRMVVTWVPAPPGSAAANAGADLELRDSHQNVPGLSLTLPIPAKWKVEVCLLFQGTGAGDEGRSAAFRLLVDSNPVDGAGVTRLYANIFQTTCYIWLITTTAPDQSVTVTARKDTGATGDSQILQGTANTTSRIIATWSP